MPILFVFYMQQDRVLEDLAKQCLDKNASPNVLRDQKTLQYLKALNKVFEHGILSSEAVRSTESQPLVNIKEGFSYFAEWCSEVQMHEVNPDDITQTAFLAWQVINTLYFVYSAYTLAWYITPLYTH